MLMFEVLHVCTCTGMKMSVFQPSHSVHHSRSLESRDSSNEEELLSSREGSGQQHQNGLHLKQNQDSDSSSDMIVSSVIFYINFRPRPTAHKKKLYASMLFFFFKAHTDFHKYIESKGTSFIQIKLFLTGIPSLETVIIFRRWEFTHQSRRQEREEKI